MVAQARGVSSLDLDLSQSRYMGGSQTGSQTDTYTEVELRGEAENSGKYMGYKISSAFKASVGLQREFYVGLPEFYAVQKAISPDFHLVVGRSLRHWSRLDEEFNVGIWQPQLRWDYLAPIQQGLTGIFFDWDLGSQSQLTFFTSPMSLPDQGPQFELKGGRFSSSNRWFYRPQSRYRLFANSVKRSGQIFYDLQNPSTEDLIFHSSFGVALRMRPAGPFWLQLSYAYKPMNQIHLGLECTNRVDIATLDVQALIHPKIIKHNVVTLESGFDQVDRRGYLSLTGDFPGASEMPADWEESSLHPMAFLGGAFEHFVGDWRYPVWLRYSYMKAIEFTGRRKASILGDRVESSLDRYPFKDVAAIGARILLAQNLSRNISLNTRYLYSMPERGGWINASLDWGMGDFKWQVGLDVLGADVDPSSAKAGLLSRYRANDRLSGGLSYVF